MTAGAMPEGFRYPAEEVLAGRTGADGATGWLDRTVVTDAALHDEVRLVVAAAMLDPLLRVDLVSLRGGGASESRVHVGAAVAVLDAPAQRWAWVRPATEVPTLVAGALDLGSPAPTTDIGFELTADRLRSAVVPPELGPDGSVTSVTWTPEDGEPQRITVLRRGADGARFVVERTSAGGGLARPVSTPQLWASLTPLAFALDRSQLLAATRVT